MKHKTSAFLIGRPRKKSISAEGTLQNGRHGRRFTRVALLMKPSDGTRGCGNVDLVCIYTTITEE